MSARQQRSNDTAATDASTTVPPRRLTTPRAAAVAGILFAVLYGTSYLLILLSIAGDSGDIDHWVEDQVDRIRLAVSLMPFAGIAFLWFMGVTRDRLKHLEDQFYSTLFLGSGLLYLAMTFAATAIAGGLLAVDAFGPERPVGAEVYLFARAVMYQIANVYAIRMAGMFMVVLGTIWMRTGVMPRWLAVVTYVSAAALLISIGFTRWIIMVFPAWVMLISVYILYLNYRYSTDEIEAALADGG